jgi:predicted MFS family arabinose efflux permease
LLLVQAAYGFSFSVFFLLPKFLKTELHATPDAIGSVSAAALGGAVLAVPFVSVALSRWNRKALLLIGTSLGALSSVGFFVVTEVTPWLYALRVIQGVSFAIVFNATATMVTEIAPPARLGQSIGLIGLAGLVTNAIAPAIGEPVATAYGWPATFAIAALMSALSGVLCLGIRVPHGAAEKPEKADGAAHPFSPRTLVIFTVSALAGAGLGTMFTFVTPFALERGMAHVSGFFIGYTLAAVAVRLTLGQLADRVGRRVVSCAGLLIYSVTVLATARLDHGWLEYLGAALGLAHGLLYPALNALALEHSAPPQRGTLMVCFNGAFNVGNGSAIVLLGLFANAHGYPMTFLLAGTGTLLGILALWRLPLAQSR